MDSQCNDQQTFFQNTEQSVGKNIVSLLWVDKNVVSILWLETSAVNPPSPSQGLNSNTSYIQHM